jgi:hypothetical protein
MKKNKYNINQKFEAFFYEFEYQILLISGILSGLLIIYIANNYFINSDMYYFLFIFGFFVMTLGFILEYAIKYFKQKNIENSFGYFLSDISREYKNTKNLSLSLTNVASQNVYGSIDTEIQRIATRVSWGEDFEDALKNINKSINSPIIEHSLLLFKTYKKTNVPLYKAIYNISKDILVYKQETQKENYFKNLFNLCIVFFIIFLFSILFIDFIIGKSFLWYSNKDILTKLFFDNFLLYISLLISFFTAFVMYSIKGVRNISLLKYIAILFIIVVLMFQVFIPKPDAEGVLIETINNMYLEDYKFASLDKIIALQSLSAKQIVDKTETEMVYFIPLENRECGIKCAKFTVIVSDAMFFDFEINKVGNSIFIFYKENK